MTAPRSSGAATPSTPSASASWRTTPPWRRRRGGRFRCPARSAATWRASRRPLQKKTTRPTSSAARGRYRISGGAARRSRRPSRRARKGSAPTRRSRRTGTPSGRTSTGPSRRKRVKSREEEETGPRPGPDLPQLRAAAAAAAGSAARGLATAATSGGNRRRRSRCGPDAGLVVKDLRMYNFIHNNKTSSRRPGPRRATARRPR